MTKTYRWVTKKSLNEDFVEEVRKRFNLKYFIAKTIVNRGYDDLNKINEYLNPNLSMLYDPFLLDGIKESVLIIKEHINKNNKITIYGDYDVDGITSTSILYRTLKKLGANVDFYIPDRLQEGYGINSDAINRIHESGTNLIITVDCGITSIKEVSMAKSYGMDIIITDHHQVPDILPNALCIINPHIKDSKYPFKDLSGVGVAFKLCSALIDEEALEYLDIVSIGTIADIVPLTSENRIIVKEGLKRLITTKNKGLRALIKVSGLENMVINTHHVGFILAPRLNAAGRLKSAISCVKLLTTEDENEANKIANYLNNENTLRQELEKKILDEAIMQVENNIDLSTEKFIVLYSNNWHPGIIGIVSSRITEIYSRPSILISVQDGIGKGSGRSIKGFNIYESLKYSSEYLIKYGGHEMAAGITIKSENIEAFKEKINNYANDCLNDVDLVPIIEIESHIKDEKINADAVKQINLLEPFGNGNVAPIYSIDNLVIKNISTVKGNRHLKLCAHKDGVDYDIIAFDMGSEINKLKVNDLIDVAGYIKINEWNNVEQIEVIAKDIKIKERNIEYFKNLLKTMMDLQDVQIKDICCNNMIDMRGISDKNEYVLKTFKSDEDVAVIVNTRFQLQKLLKYLKRNNFFDYKLSQGEIYEQRVIFWNINNANLINRFKNILFYDIPFNAKMFYNILAQNNGDVKIHLLFGDNDLLSNFKDLKEILPRRSDFVKIYKNISKNSNDILFKDQIYSKFNINTVKVLYCIKVLNETGLINVKESDNIFVLGRNNMDEKIDLQENENLKSIYVAKDNFLKFANTILRIKFKEETA